MDTVTNTEPAVSTTPKLASLLHTYFSVQRLAQDVCTYSQLEESQREVKRHQAANHLNRIYILSQREVDLII